MKGSGDGSPCRVLPGLDAGPSETTLALAIPLDGLLQALVVELGPEALAEVQLGVGQPEEDGLLNR